MEFTVEKQIENIDERIGQYLFLIKKTIEDISELLEKRKELIQIIKT
ncbi:MAG: hypothetical protein LBH16_01655 [Treponema sp.]|jgi:hypothetical protein|nr:hypothetical protein [Treponema sp.]